MLGTKSLLKRSVFLGAVVLALGVVATPAMAQQRAYAIEPTSLSKALREYGRVSGRQIIFTEDLVRGKTSPSLNGNYSPDAALDQLLAGSGLKATIAPSGAIMIERATGASAKGEGGAGSAAADSESAEGEAIVVTGTRQRRANPSVAVNSYDSERIQESGRTSVGDFLNTLPEVSVALTQDRRTSTTGQQSVRLRGFPVGTTLTLLNGRRLAPSGDLGVAFDLSSLPLGLIERVDILPTGSSAIYGSDAIAGVVNFITRTDLDRVHATASYGAAKDYSEQNFTLAWGHKWDRAAFSVGIAYDNHDKLFGRDRSLPGSGDFREFSALGGIDRRVLNCNPGNVRSLSGNLPGLPSNFAAIPSGLSGRPSINDFAATAGTENRCGLFANSALIPAVERVNVLASGHFDLTPSIQAFMEFIYSRAENSFATTGSSYSAILGASNPFNPFGVNVRITALAPVPSDNVSKRKYWRPVVGLRGDVLKNWDWEIAYWYSRDKNHVDNLGVPNQAALTAALASADPNLAFNPFVTEAPASQAVLSDAFRVVQSDYRSDVHSVDARLRGDLFRLPAGPVSMVVGGEFYWYDLKSQDIVSGVSGSATADRDVKSAFIEVRAPIFEGAHDRDLLTFSVAGRYDSYSDFGDTFNPQFGLELRPIPSVLIRASYAEAFRAPALVQLYGATFPFPAAVVDTQQPGNPVVTPLTTFGANPDLGPETGKATSLGIVWTPNLFKGLRASIDYWRLRQDNRISSPGSQVLVDFPELFPGRVLRDPVTNDIISIDARFVNFGSLKADGFDIRLSTKFDTPVGQFEPRIDWTIFTRYKAALTPDAPLQNRLNRATRFDAWAPRHRATVGLGWSRGEFSARAAGRYVGRYLDYQQPPNTNHLGDFWLWDASVRINLARLLFSNSDHNIFLNASVTDIFDRDVDFSNNASLGYDPAQYDILGRFARVGLEVAW